METKKVKVNFPIYKIVSDGGISSEDRGEGRIYPCIIIDINENKEIQDLFKIHQQINTGDVLIHWGVENSFFRSKKIFLTLEFSRPMPISFGIEFLISKNFNLIDGIIQSRGVCIASGKFGNKVSDVADKSIIIEVPNVGFDQKWDKIFKQSIFDFYKKKGMNKKEAKNFTENHIKQMRDLWSLRREPK